MDPLGSVFNAVGGALIGVASVLAPLLVILL
jgi:hypothetical protein